MSDSASITVPRDPNARFDAFFKAIVESKKIWLLIDEHGSVLLNTDDEECVPVWPSEAHALQWATEEWEGFQAEPISLAKWKSRWTMGLEEDELSIVVYPDTEGEGLVLYPDEFEQELLKRERR
ncbi:hypothetical protein VST7929_03117 [Vibrio stylophorae]|uniref:DUF2750 domain-containing protein n=1 Tax=Vibrio stylophorae TaxID=659351 RepID=A0ABN8DZ52_9VIBR|nr:DUF2750 domain-containing protein [Vibrio stylophorae]CAH0535564.1 hypothetical protein VST7929_03117 [Vibrio stylophorae]